jgi:hypothetical protein
VNAILEGERNPLALAKLRNERIQASEEVIAKSQVGDYRPEHLFTLQQSLTAYRSYQTLIEDCDREVRRALQRFRPRHRPSVAADQDAIQRRSLACGVESRLWRRSHPNSGNESAPASHKPFLERSARTSPSSGALPHLPPGWPVPG